MTGRFEGVRAAADRSGDVPATTDKSVALCFGTECRVCDDWCTAVATRSCHLSVAIRILSVQPLILYSQLPPFYHPPAARHPQTSRRSSNVSTQTTGPQLV